MSSTRIRLRPGKLVAGSFMGDTGTAGSCALLAQSAVPCLLYAQPPAAGAEGAAGAAAEGAAASGGAALAAAAGGGASPRCSLELKGGTDAAMAPPVDYLALVLAPTLRRARNSVLVLPLKIPHAPALQCPRLSALAASAYLSQPTVTYALCGSFREQRAPGREARGRDGPARVLP